jgi:adenosine kinase
VQKTGWSHDEVLDRVGTWVITLGPRGVRIEQKGAEPVEVAAVPEVVKAEPTGVGDAFRAGLLAGLSWGLDLARSAQIGCLLAVYVVEQIGTQEYHLTRPGLLARCAAAYGDEAAAEIGAHLETLHG